MMWMLSFRRDVTAAEAIEAASFDSDLPEDETAEEGSEAREKERGVSENQSGDSKGGQISSFGWALVTQFFVFAVVIRLSHKDLTFG